jgi:hypothetical protein
MRTVKTDERGRVRVPGMGKGVIFAIDRSSQDVWQLTRLVKAEPAPAKGRVVKGPDGWLVWQGEVKMDPVEALNADRQEDSQT